MKACKTDSTKKSKKNRKRKSYIPQPIKSWETKNHLEQYYHSPSSKTFPLVFAKTKKSPWSLRNMEGSHIRLLPAQTLVVWTGKRALISVGVGVMKWGCLIPTMKVAGEGTIVAAGMR
ncbi:Uncharacterized protein Fot_54792 [Forsythia ovata]|uniref:Uncharacterized protein n=1 Tax=Forsythia ovata TaxID=205694 RepID=A0ABD1P6N8_9LAMI